MQSKTKVLLLVMLASAFLIPVAALDTNTLYDEFFPDATDTPQYMKDQVIAHLTSDKEPIPLPFPDGQVEVGERALEIIYQMQNTTDPAELQELQQKLDGMTEEMLRVGIVLREKYEEDPEMWDKRLEEYSIERYYHQNGTEYEP